jgi:hypothetical protein
MTVEEDRINETIPELSRRARTAFAIGCAERTIPFLEWYFGPRQAPAFQKAIDLCWSYAVGDSVSDADLEASYAHLDALADKLYEKDEAGTPYLFAVMAILFAVQSAMDPEAKVVQTSIGYSRGAACGEDEQRFHETHTQEETSWQTLALGVALATPTPTRDMFQHLPSNPKWLQSWRARKPPRPAGK